MMIIATLKKIKSRLFSDGIFYLGIMRSFEYHKTQNYCKRENSYTCINYSELLSFFIYDFIRSGLLWESKRSQTAEKLSNIINRLDICLMSSFIVIT